MALMPLLVAATTMRHIRPVPGLTLAGSMMRATGAGIGRPSILTVTVLPTPAPAAFSASA
jgi:hypothetical protein